MFIGQLFHVSVRTADLDATVRFYTQVLGMLVAERPPIGFPGAWLKPALPGCEATLHIYAGDAAREADGTVQQGGGAIDHVSIVCRGFSATRERIASFGLDWRENMVPETPLWQIFVYDPNGVQLELTYHRDAEAEPDPQIPPERQYKARERWFRPELYRQFAQA